MSDHRTMTYSTKFRDMTMRRFKNVQERVARHEAKHGVKCPVNVPEKAGQAVEPTLVAIEDLNNWCDKIDQERPVRGDTLKLADGQLYKVTNVYGEWVVTRHIKTNQMFSWHLGNRKTVTFTRVNDPMPENKKKAVIKPQTKTYYRDRYLEARRKLGRFLSDPVGLAYWIRREPTNKSTAGVNLIKSTGRLIGVTGNPVGYVLQTLGYEHLAEMDIEKVAPHKVRSALLSYPYVEDSDWPAGEYQPDRTEYALTVYRNLSFAAQLSFYSMSSFDSFKNVGFWQSDYSYWVAEELLNSGLVEGRVNRNTGQACELSPYGRNSADVKLGPTALGLMLCGRHTEPRKNMYPKNEV